MRDASRRLVEAYRTHEVPDEATVEAMLERLVDQAPASPRPWGRVATSVGLAVALAAAVLLLLRGGFLVLGADADRRTPDAAMHERQDSDPPSESTRRPELHAPTPLPAAEIPDEIPPPSTELEAPAAPERRTPRPPAVDRSVASPVDAPTPADALAREARLLAAAQAALAEGSPEHALAKLDEHRHTYPEGVMVLERMALRAIALCRTDAREEGRDVARRLFSAHPKAPHRTRVHSACGQFERPPADAP